MLLKGDLGKSMMNPYQDINVPSTDTVKFILILEEEGIREEVKPGTDNIENESVTKYLFKLFSSENKLIEEIGNSKIYKIFSMNINGNTIEYTIGLQDGRLQLIKVDNSAKQK